VLILKNEFEKEPIILFIVDDYINTKVP